MPLSALLLAERRYAAGDAPTPPPVAPKMGTVPAVVGPLAVTVLVSVVSKAALPKRVGIERGRSDGLLSVIVMKCQKKFQNVPSFGNFIRTWTEQRKFETWKIQNAFQYTRFFLIIELLQRRDKIAFITLRHTMCF